jgi:hypothetical protein
VRTGEDDDAHDTLHGLRKRIILRIIASRDNVNNILPKIRKATPRIIALIVFLLADLLRGFRLVLGTTSHLNLKRISSLSLSLSLSSSSSPSRYPSGPIERNPGTTNAIEIIIVIPRKLFLQNLSAGKLLKVLTILAKSRKRRRLEKKRQKEAARAEQQDGALDAEV